MGRVDSENVCSFIDWLPTLCSIAGVEDIPKRLDGEDISDIWFGAERPRSEPLFWKASATGAAPVIRDGKWKLHLKRRRGQEIELYDLSSDPDESENVAAQHPDIVDVLTRKLQNWEDELPDHYEKRKK
jgi:N-acetylgalactosamine-6-sulfatase